MASRDVALGAREDGVVAGDESWPVGVADD